MKLSIGWLSKKLKIYDGLSASRSSGLSSQCDIQVIITESKDHDVDTSQYQKPAYVAVGLIMAMTCVSVFFPMFVASFGLGEVYKPCMDACRVTLVESIPENLTYPAGAPEHTSTYSAWLSLLQKANSSIDIASYYWTMRGGDLGSFPSDWQGEAIFTALLKAGLEPHIRLRVVQDIHSPQQSNKDIAELLQKGAASVRSLNFTRWFGDGIIHTKLWIVDKKHLYIGSANMDWRSLTQVKELGVVVSNCPCLANDVQKIFDVYWYLGVPDIQIPSQWPTMWNTKYNKETPAEVMLNNKKSHAYFSSSPPVFCPEGRTNDLDAILDVIDKAEKYVHIAVMDYFPITQYTNPIKFWPAIDDALRRVALEKRVEVCILGSLWNHTDPDMLHYLLSLSQLNGARGASIHVKLFSVPATKEQAKIPFARVNHNKYMVTDNTAYIGTSNWSGDYFTHTAGVGIIVSNTNGTMTTNTTQTLQQQLSAVFDRDWNSSYAHPVKEAIIKFNITDDTVGVS